MAGWMPRQRLIRWQGVRTWARLIRGAEGLLRVDVRDLLKLAAHDLGQLRQEVPPRLRWFGSVGQLRELLATKPAWEAS